MKLYYAPRTRSSRPRWLLEELGVPYELVRLDLGKHEHKSPEYRKIQPHGLVPALVDGEVTIFESVAICLYLADKFPDKGLAPPPGSPERGAYYQWMIYAAATVDPTIERIVELNKLRDEERPPGAMDKARARWREIGAVLTRATEGREFLVGDRLTAADVLMSSLMSWAMLAGLLADFPSVQAWSKNLGGRPAAKRARAD